MGIYIKGVLIPTSCKDCGLKVNCDECEGWECVCVPLHKTIGYYDDLLSDKRRDDCPLINVQPHGDLIDRNTVEGLALWVESPDDDKIIWTSDLNEVTAVIPASDD